MTDFPTKKSGWRRREAERKWQTIFGAFITLVLILAVFNGIYKSISFGKSVGKSSWDGEEPLAAFLNTDPPTVAVYRPDDQKIFFVILDNQLYFETNGQQKPVERVRELNSSNDRQKVLGAVSKITRFPINNYIIFDNSQQPSRENLEKIFVDFASIATPISLLTKGATGVGTNMTRSDAFRLWWQLKSLSLNSLNFVDLSTYSVDIVVQGDEKVLGLDNVQVHNVISQIVENPKVFEAKESILIENASGVVEIGSLVNDFVTAAGAKVERVTFVDEVETNCTISSRNINSYLVKYLEKILRCDITSVPSMSENELKILLGVNFASRYIF